MNASERLAWLTWQAAIGLRRHGIPPRRAFDPMTLLLLLEVIMALLRLLAACSNTKEPVEKSYEQAIEFLRRPGILGRRRLDRVIQKALEKYPENADLMSAMKQALLSLGRELPEEEVIWIMKEITR